MQNAKCISLSSSLDCSDLDDDMTEIATALITWKYDERRVSISVTVEDEVDCKQTCTFEVHPYVCVDYVED